MQPPFSPSPPSSTKTQTLSKARRPLQALVDDRPRLPRHGHRRGLDPDSRGPGPRRRRRRRRLAHVLLALPRVPRPRPRAEGRPLRERHHRDRRGREPGARQPRPARPRSAAGHVAGAALQVPRQGRRLRGALAGRGRRRRRRGPAGQPRVPAAARRRALPAVAPRRRPRGHRRRRPREPDGLWQVQGQVPDGAQHGDRVRRRRRRRRGQAGLYGGGRVPQEARAVHGRGRQDPQGRAAGRPARDRQDAARQGDRRRGRRALLLDLRLRVRRDVCRRRRLEGARPVQEGQGERAVHRVCGESFEFWFFFSSFGLGGAVARGRAVPRGVFRGRGRKPFFFLLSSSAHPLFSLVFLLPPPSSSL